MTSGMPTFILAQSQGGGDTLYQWVALGVVLVILIGMWKVFAKAGQPGWACMVPVYNGIVLLEIDKRPLWWLILFIIPFVNFVAALVVSLDVARNFGKSAAFGLGLALLPFICYPMLGFSDDRYQA